jgi:K+-sensing histidine kinase KdpD
MDHLPLANDGSVVETFLSGIAFSSNEVDQNANELLGFKKGLGIKSQVEVVFKVRTQHRGVMLVASATPNFFVPEDLRFLEAVARWIGLVVGRSELVEQIQYKDSEQDQDKVARELLTIMAHDLRNYLQPLRGRLDLIMERAQREGREKDIRDVESNLHTLDALARGISDVVDITRLNQGVLALTPVPVDLKKIIGDAVTAFAAKSLPLSVRMPGEVLVTADPQRLQQTLETMLLYMNSLSAEPVEMTIDVSIEERADGPWVLLSVSVAGLALPDVSDTMVRPFISSSHATQLGVRLYLASQIALAHHGTLTLHSTNVQEVQLTLAFPVEEEELVVRGENKITFTRSV